MRALVCVCVLVRVDVLKSKRVCAPVGHPRRHIHTCTHTHMYTQAGRPAGRDRQMKSLAIVRSVIHSISALTSSSMPCLLMCVAAVVGLLHHCWRATSQLRTTH